MRALTTEDAPAPVRSLDQKLADIRADAYGIGKDDIEMMNKERTKKWKIKGHTVEAVLAEMRPLLEKHRVGITPQLVERTYSGNRCDVLVDFEFINLEQLEDKRVIRWAGADTDNGGKAYAKACTNALKELFKKLFLITDRDDAKEEEERVDYQTADTAAAREVEASRDRERAAVEKWAKSFRSALTNAPSEKEIERLMREHKGQLFSEHTPDVTRDFFIDLAERRKTALAEARAE